MDVTVRHSGTGDSCVVCVPEGGTVVGLKADALNEMFPGSINADREAENVAAHIEGCEEELDDTDRVADTGLEDGGAVQLVPQRSLSVGRGWQRALMTVPSACG